METVSLVTESGCVERTRFNGELVESFCAQCGHIEMTDPVSEYLEDIPCSNCEAKSLHPIMSEIDREVAENLAQERQLFMLADAESYRRGKEIERLEKIEHELRMKLQVAQHQTEL